MKSALLKLTTNTGETLHWDDQHQQYRTKTGGTPKWDKYLWCDEEWPDDPVKRIVPLPENWSGLTNR